MAQLCEFRNEGKKPGRRKRDASSVPMGYVVRECYAAAMGLLP